MKNFKRKCQNCCSHQNTTEKIITATGDQNQILLRGGKAVKFNREICDDCGQFLGDTLL